MEINKDFMQRQNKLIFEGEDQQCEARRSLGQLLLEEKNVSLQIVRERTILYDNRGANDGVFCLTVRHEKKKDNVQWTYQGLIDKSKNIHKNNQCLYKQLCKVMKQDQCEVYKHNPALGLRSNIVSAINVLLGDDNMGGAAQPSVRFNYGGLKVYWVLEPKEKWTMHQPEEAWQNGELIYEKSWNRKTNTLIVQIHPKFLIKCHHRCFKVDSRVIHQVQKLENDTVCSCCQMPVQSLSDKTHMTTKHCASPVTKIMPLQIHGSLTRPSGLKWINEQHLMIQYVRAIPQAVPNESDDDRGVIFEYYDHGPILLNQQSEASGAVHRSIFGKWEDVLDHAEFRFQKIIRPKKKNRLKTFKALALKLNLMGIHRALDKTVDHLFLMVLHGQHRENQMDKLGASLAIHCCNRVRKIVNVARNTTYGLRCGFWRVFVANSLLPHSEELERASNPFTWLLNTGKNEPVLTEAFRKFHSFLWNEFGLEFLSSSSHSLPFLTMQGILLTMSKDPNHLGLSRPCLALATLLSGKQMHQILFSGLRDIKAGEKMSPFHSPMKSAVQYDLSLAYSTQLAWHAMPCGKPLIFSRLPQDLKNDGKVEEEEPDEDKNPRTNWKLRRYGGPPHQTLEFMVVFYLLKLIGKQYLIHQAYHNFSHQGQYTVGKKSLDLLVIVSTHQKPAKRMVWAYQVHHCFTHTCNKAQECREQVNYTRGLSRSILAQESLEVDTFWRTYVKEQWGSSLEIIYTCHDGTWASTNSNNPNITYSRIEEAFAADPDLSSLADFGTTSRTINEDTLKILLQRTDIEIFVIAEGREGVQEDDREKQLGHITTKKKDGNTIMSRSTHSPTLFNRETLLYLLTYRGFVIDKMFHIIIYKTNGAFQQVFERLIELRMHHLNERDAYRSQNLKDALNKVIGVFGTFKTANSFVTIHPRPIRESSPISIYKYRQLEKGAIEVTRLFNKPRPMYNLLPLHISILSHYRQRIVSTFFALEKLLDPTKYRVVACHTDAILILLSEDRIEKCSIFDEHVFQTAWASYASDTKRPGYLTLCKRWEGHFGLYMPGVQILRTVRYPSLESLTSHKRGSIASSPATDDNNYNKREFSLYKNSKFKIVGTYGDGLVYCIPHSAASCSHETYAGGIVLPRYRAPSLNNG